MHIKHSYIIPALIGTIALGSAGTAFAAENNGRDNDRKDIKEMRKDFREDIHENGAMGIITAISGTTLTITSAQPGSATTTLTVNAASTTVKKMAVSDATSTKPQMITQSLADLSVGERVVVRGTRTGTTIVATEIVEVPTDMPKNPIRDMAKDAIEHMKDDRSMQFGRGVVGVVQDMNGTTFNLKAMNGTVYAVNAASSTVRNGAATSSLANITNGERVAVQGDVANTTITARVIMENIPDAPKAGKKEHATSSSSFQDKKHDFFEKCKDVFKNIFGKK